MDLDNPWKLERSLDPDNELPFVQDSGVDFMTRRQSAVTPEAPTVAAREDCKTRIRRDADSGDSGAGEVTRCSIILSVTEGGDGEASVAVFTGSLFSRFLGLACSSSNSLASVIYLFIMISLVTKSYPLVPTHALHRQLSRSQFGLGP